MKANCVVCGKVFEVWGHAMTCGKECSKEHHYRSRRKRSVKANCAVCGKEFEKRNSRHLTCSRTCSHSNKTIVQTKYKASPEGKATQKKHRESPEFKAAMRAYHTSPEFRAARRKYNASPNGKVAARKYWTSPKGKSCAKKYNTTPKRKAYNRFKYVAAMVGISPVRYALLKPLEEPHDQAQHPDV